MFMSAEANEAAEVGGGVSGAKEPRQAFNFTSSHPKRKEPSHLQRLEPSTLY